MCPQFARGKNSDSELTVQMSADSSVYHKSRMPKMMFLAVTTHPRAEYDFDGKIGLWPSTVQRKANIVTCGLGLLLVKCVRNYVAFALRITQGNFEQSKFPPDKQLSGLYSVSQERRHA